MFQSALGLTHVTKLILPILPTFTWSNPIEPANLRFNFPLFALILKRIITLPLIFHCIPSALKVTSVASVHTTELPAKQSFCCKAVCFSRNSSIRVFHSCFISWLSTALDHNTQFIWSIAFLLWKAPLTYHFLLDWLGPVPTISITEETISIPQCSGWTLASN